MTVCVMKKFIIFKFRAMNYKLLSNELQHILLLYFYYIKYVYTNTFCIRSI